MTTGVDSWCERFAMMRAILAELGSQILSGSALDYDKINGIFAGIAGSEIDGYISKDYGGKVATKHAITQFVAGWNDRLARWGHLDTENGLNILAGRTFLQSLATLSLAVDDTEGRAGAIGFGSTDIKTGGKASLEKSPVGIKRAPEPGPILGEIGGLQPIVPHEQLAPLTVR